MVAFFCSCFGSFQVDESCLRVRLYLHQGLDLAAAIAFWSELTGIPGRSCEAVPGGGGPDDPHAKHVHGCVGVRYSCSATHRSIMGLVGALLSGAAIPG